MLLNGLIRHQRDFQKFPVLTGDRGEKILFDTAYKVPHHQAVGIVAPGEIVNSPNGNPQATSNVIIAAMENKVAANIANVIFPLNLLPLDFNPHISKSAERIIYRLE